MDRQGREGETVATATGAGGRGRPGSREGGAALPRERDPPRPEGGAWRCLSGRARLAGDGLPGVGCPAGPLPVVPPLITALTSE